MATKIRMRPPVYARTVAVTEDARASASGAIPMVLKVSIRSSIKKNTEALLETMRKSSLFKGEDLEKIAKNFSAVDLSGDKGLEIATEVLCDLVSNVIRPAMLKAAGHLDVQDQMLTFDDKAQELLKLTLPAGKDVEEAIREYAERSDKAKSCIREIEAIEGIYRDAAAQIDNSDADLLALAEDLFNTKKAALLKQNEERKEAADSVNGALDALTGRVDRMRDGLLAGLVGLKKDMDKEQSSRKCLIGRALTITGSV